MPLPFICKGAHPEKTANEGIVIMKDALAKARQYAIANANSYQ